MLLRPSTANLKRENLYFISKPSYALATDVQLPKWDTAIIKWLQSMITSFWNTFCGCGVRGIIVDQCKIEDWTCQLFLFAMQTCYKLANFLD